MEYWCDKDKRIEYVHGDGVRRGGAYQRNKGNRMAKANVISVCDAGDEYHPVKTTVALEYLTRNPDVDLFYHSAKTLNEQGQEVELNFAFDPMLQKYPRSISHPTVSYYKDTILKHPYREDCVDTDQYEAMLLTLQREGYKFGYVRNVLLQKWNMSSLEGYRNIVNAMRKKIEVYKEFGVEIDAHVYRKAQVKPEEIYAGL